MLIVSPFFGRNQFEVGVVEREHKPNERIMVLLDGLMIERDQSKRSAKFSRSIDRLLYATETRSY